MDHAPVALTLLGDVLEEIRTECRELKGLREECAELRESNGRLREAVEALETVNVKHQAAIRSLATAVARQNGEVHAQKDTLAAVQHEAAAVRLLLQAHGKMSRDSVVDTIEGQTINAAEMQSVIIPPSQMLLTTPNRPPIIRHMSAESSMTFCTAEQSVQRKRSRTLGLAINPLQLQHGEQRANPNPDAITTEETGRHKKRKTISSHFQLTPPKPVQTFAVPALPHRLTQSDSSAALKKPSDIQTEHTGPSQTLTAPEAGQSLAPAAPEPLSEETPSRGNPNCRVLGARAAQRKTSKALAHSTDDKAQPGLVQGDSDVDMEDNIVVALKDGRTMKSFQNIAALPAAPPTLSVTRFTSIVDKVLQDIDVDAPTDTEVNQPSQALQSDDEQGVAADIGHAHPRKHRYTAEQRSWLFEHVKEAFGGIPTTSFPDLTCRFNTKFNEQRTESGIAAVVAKLRSEYHATNGSQKTGGGQDGRLRKKPQTEIQSAVESEPQELDTPSPTAVDSQKSQRDSITRVGLLSQFKARKGRTRTSEGSQSPEQSVRAGK